jgi:hypothetical protein
MRAAVSADRTVHLLRQKRAAEALMTVVLNDRRYVVGFAHRHYAELVRVHVSRSPVLVLTQNHDMESLVCISKSRMVSSRGRSFATEEAAFADFVMMPFQDNVGIAFAHEMVEFDGGVLAFRSQVVDAADPAWWRV